MPVHSKDVDADDITVFLQHFWEEAKEKLSLKKEEISVYLSTEISARKSERNRIDGGRP